MNGVQLRFFTYEDHKHDGHLVYEWLLATAKRIGVSGGTAFRALAGFGRHGRMHEERFFELAGSEPMLVEFIATAEQADRLLHEVERSQVNIFYARVAVEYGSTGTGK